MQLLGSIALLLALWACLTSAEVGNALPDSDVLADDACLGDEGDCSLSLLQLRGAKVEEYSTDSLGTPAAEAGKEGGQVDAQMREHRADGSETAEHEEDPLVLADLDGDGEVQHEEALSFVGGRGERSREDMVALFQAHDTDASKGLNSREFAAAMGAWYGAGASYHQGPYSSGGQYHYHGPYGGGGGGGIYRGPLGGGASYHYHRNPWGGGSGSVHYHSYR